MGGGGRGPRGDSDGKNKIIIITLDAFVHIIMPHSLPQLIKRLVEWVCVEGVEKDACFRDIYFGKKLHKWFYSNKAHPPHWE